eukprot:TRINITY_DN6796_c0_g1_i3.p1 TRINITY_DN6796_c0_g1~~TRINITY_DN6796_c0_g1_i3.p1  ORF type:complete len:343 (+),score=47.34 TRINITY_DN6796_c0_g1_i3:97-1125(+)
MEPKQLSNHPFVCFPHNSCHTFYVRDMIVLKDGTLVSGSDDETLQRWTATAQLIASFEGHTNDIMCLAEVDDNTFMSGSMDQTVKMWNKTTGECLHTGSSLGYIPFSLLTLRNKSFFLCGLFDGSIQKRRLGDDHNVVSVRIHSSAVYCLCELKDGRIVSGSQDRKLEVWDVEMMTETCTLIGHQGWIWKVVELTTEPKPTIASGSDDKSVRIWDVTTGGCLRVLQGHTGNVRGLVVMLDGTLVSGSWDATIRVWNITNGECESVCQVSKPVCFMRQTKDGSLLYGYYGKAVIEIRKTWLSKPPNLVELCCQFIRKHHTKFNMEALQQTLPGELSELIKLSF